MLKKYDVFLFTSEEFTNFCEFAKCYGTSISLIISYYEDEMSILTTRINYIQDIYFDYDRDVIHITYIEFGKNPCKCEEKVKGVHLELSRILSYDFIFNVSCNIHPLKEYL